ncbi:hypothetical protein C5B42_02825 [Candidatus Cerribacteria bacterium 'Amazon FNV 2010 28 9']|uniref:Uncharacterized protein n=1 Tax=Candidatus Cerribacteria bacterium 'Amazon FNV 2010 28 9' TaxID=2081795 RepID=A0A317JP90_9BACT|nr:MAG: hypothetical protein C5B42_02825 [Candidatus Cerribacteria bacterium 'Amazon FNV 2010 28 9']
MKKIFHSNPLFTIFFIPVIVDVVGTVLGQPKEYWTSGYKVFNEAVPIYPLLQLHPLAFIIPSLLVWLTFTYWLTKKLKEPLNLWAAMALLVGHGYNSVTWFRLNLYRAGLFAGQDQLSKALSLIPMTIYILLIGWVAMRGVMAYIQQRKSTKNEGKR